MRESVTAQCRRNSSPSCINHYGVPDGGMDMGREADDLATARPGPGGRRHAERRPRSARPRAAPPTRHTTRWPDAGRRTRPAQRIMARREGY